MTTLPNLPHIKAFPYGVSSEAPDKPALIDCILLDIYNSLNLVLSVCSSILPADPPPINPATKTLPLLDKATVKRAPHAMSTINSSGLRR